MSLGLKPSSLLPALAAALIAAALAGSAHARAFTFTLSGDDASIWNAAGLVRLEAASGSNIEIEVTTQGRDADQLRIDNAPLDNHPTLRVLYPTNRIVYPPLGRWSNTTTSVHPNGTWGKGLGGWSSRRIEIKGGGSGTEAWADLVIRVPRGRKLSVHSIAGSGEVRNVDGRLLIDGGSGGVNVEQCSGELKIDIGSGAVKVAGFEGVLDIDTGSGSVDVSDVRGASVRLDTGSGGVAGQRITTSDLYVDTGSGSVSMLALDAKKGKIDTGSGGVTLALLNRTADLDIDTGSGSVRVSVPPDFGATVYLKTGSGDIRTELPMKIDVKDDGVLRGSVGDGAGRLGVDTGSGGVTLLASGGSATTGTMKFKPR